jgi:hypothetical protein
MAAPGAPAATPGDRIFAPRVCRAIGADRHVLAVDDPNLAQTLPEGISNVVVRGRSKRCLCFFHVIKFDHRKAFILGGHRCWSLNVHKSAAARKKFPALLRDYFHGGGDKLFKEGLLVHYVDFDNISARLGLGLKGLDRHSPDCDAGERGNCHRIFRFHQLILPG